MSIKHIEQLAFNESDMFRLIMSMMFHTNKEDGQKFLCTINNVIDYYINHTPQETPQFILINSQSCPKWTRELLLQFILHKSALTMNDELYKEWKIKTQGALILPMGKKEADLKIQLYRYFRNYIKEVEPSYSRLPFGNSLIIINDNDFISKKANRNPWNEYICSTSISNIKAGTILSATLIPSDLEQVCRTLRKNNQPIPKIENIFVFHSQNKSAKTFKFNSTQLERLNRYGMGIRNCFVFNISDTPLKLYYTIHNIKYRLASNILNKEIKRYNDFENFVTFTPEEMDYLFDRKGKRGKLAIYPMEGIPFAEAKDAFIEQVLDRTFNFNNKLTLAFSDKLRELLIEDLKSVDNYEYENELSDYFLFYQKYWDNHVLPTLKEFSKDEKETNVVIPYGLSDAYKKALKNYFNNNAIRVKLCTFDRLKDITKKKIIVLSFRSTESYYKNYPNSFDNLPNQNLSLVLFNYLALRKNIEFREYQYSIDFNGLLYSSFRKDILCWNKINRPKPSDIRNFDLLEDELQDSRENSTERCTLAFENGNGKDYFVTERFIIKQKDKLAIHPLKDLEDGDCVELMPISDVIDQIKNNLIQKTSLDNKAEIVIRSNSIYQLSHEEINSDTELWKILLKRKEDQLGCQNIYDAIFGNNGGVSFNQFSKWSDPTNSMILPRKKKNRKLLLNYLGFDHTSPYYRIIHRKCLRSINDTRNLNSQIESLLKDAFLHDIDNITWTTFEEKHSDIFEILEINNLEDVKALISLLDINFTKATIVFYDKE